MHAHEGMKASGVQAHQIELDEEFVRLVKNVKSNVTDSQVHELIAKEFSTAD